MTVTPRRRVDFRFDGEFDDVPTGPAAALARMAGALLQHGDEHDGGPATLRVARLGPLLNLWLTDPECSPACLCGSGHLPSTADHRDTAPGDVRLALEPGRDGGLHLHWALVLVEKAEAAHSVPPQRRDAETPALERDPQQKSRNRAQSR